MATIQEFANRLEAEQRARIAQYYPGIDLAGPDPHYYRAYVVPGRVYTKVNFDRSGKYMVENATGIIYGIKAYGKVHKGHTYGTLDTLDDYDWSDYYAIEHR